MYTDKVASGRPDFGSPILKVAQGGLTDINEDVLSSSEVDQHVKRPSFVLVSPVLDGDSGYFTVSVQ